jgi:hypothetical protein
MIYTIKYTILFPFERVAYFTIEVFKQIADNHLADDSLRVSPSAVE